MWRDQIEMLEGHFQVIAPDLPGHGETPVPPGPATMEEMASNVSGVMDALGVSEAVVCGLSMGGYVTLALCRMLPERVRALVLVDTRAQADTEEGRANREQQAQKALNEGMAGITDTMLPKLFSPETVARRPQVVARVREMMLNTKPEGAAAALRGMAQRADHRSFLNQINVPTLIIVGNQDAITPVEDSETMQREIRGSELRIIEGAGHVSNLEQPEEFNRALLTFLQGLEA